MRLDTQIPSSRRIHMQMNRKKNVSSVICSHILHFRWIKMGTKLIPKTILGIKHLLLFYIYMLNKMSCHVLEHCAKHNLSEKNCISSRIRLVFSPFSCANGYRATNIIYSKNIAALRQNTRRTKTKFLSHGWKI